MVEIARNSTKDDWIYDEESDSCTLKQNMLIRLVREPIDNEYTLYFGYQAVGTRSQQNPCNMGWNTGLSALETLAKSPMVGFGAKVTQFSR